MNGEVYKWHDDILDDSDGECCECKWFTKRGIDEEPCASCYCGHSAFEPAREEE